MKKILYLALISALFVACSNDAQVDGLELGKGMPIDKHADHFDFPVGAPDAVGYYKAQHFKGKKNHLGEDWNALTGGNTDLGDPIYACANGYVKEVKDYKGGWGNVIRVLHYYNDSIVESLYAHCDTVLVKEKTWIDRGQKIGTIGTAHGQYLAHLHFEMRSDITMGLGNGYSKDSKGYLDPTKFIKKHR
jgi:murein DD-endopeptidase MepM/ murein hydrolase activator NlpD